MSEEAETMFFWVVAVSGSWCSLLPIGFLEWSRGGGGRGRLSRGVGIQGIL